MSKAVMISIKPEWCELIAKKQKTIEVRKTRPKIKTPFKCYIYETKGLYRESGGCLFQGLGKVIGEFVCNFIYENISYDSEGTRIPASDLKTYANGRPLYGWHISDLVIYDKPKSLYEFSKHDNTYDNAFGWMFDDRQKNVQLTRPPQSWCYVEIENAEHTI